MPGVSVGGTKARGEDAGRGPAAPVLNVVERRVVLGVGAPDGVGESLLRTLSCSRRAAKGGDEPEN